MVKRSTGLGLICVILALPTFAAADSQVFVEAVSNYSLQGSSGTDCATNEGPGFLSGMTAKAPSVNNGTDWARANRPFLDMGARDYWSVIHGRRLREAAGPRASDHGTTTMLTIVTFWILTYPAGTPVTPIIRHSILRCRRAARGSRKPLSRSSVHTDYVMM
jgi:hypothetical protein